MTWKDPLTIDVIESALELLHISYTYEDVFRVPELPDDRRIVDLNLRDENGRTWAAYGAYFSMKVNSWAWLGLDGNIVPRDKRNAVSGLMS